MNKKILLAISLLSYFDNCIGADSILSSNSSDSSDIPLQSYIACKSFETNHLKLELIDSADKNIACYQAVYQDCGWRNPWFSGVGDNNLYLYAPGSIPLEYLRQLEEEGDEPICETDHDLIQKKDIEFFHRKEALGIYEYPKSFSDYLIRDKETDEVVGRFIFRDYEKDGRIEKGIYLLNKFRKKGYGSEILTGILTNVVEPAIGKPFAIMRWNVDIYPEIIVYPSFKGVFSTIAPWCNYPSIVANIRSGCGLSWVKNTPITFYPRGDDVYMDKSDLEAFRKFTRYSFLLEESDPKSRQEKGNNLRVDFLFTLIKYKDSFIVQQIIKSLYMLLATEDDATFESTLNLLLMIGEEPDNLRDSIDPQKLQEFLPKHPQHNKNFDENLG